MDFNKLIDMYPPDFSDEDDGSDARHHYGSKKLKQMKHQAELDLHGHTVEEALAELRLFLGRSAREGYRKVLIIHGKGYHSQGGPRLAGAVRRYLESWPLAGRLMTPPARYGGSGAIWVILKKGSRR